MGTVSCTALTASQGVYMTYILCNLNMQVPCWIILTTVFELCRPSEFFDGVFLAKDTDVAAFVDYIHGATKHVILLYIVYLSNFLYYFISPELKEKELSNFIQK